MNKKTVWKSQRYLYELKQVGRQWYAKLSHFLLSHNYKCSSVDHCLFLKHVERSTIALIVYVDDIVLTRNDVKEIQAIMGILHHHFCIKNLGDLTYFLALKLHRIVKVFTLVKENIPFIYLKKLEC